MVDSDISSNEPPPPEGASGDGAISVGAHTLGAEEPVSTEDHAGAAGPSTTTFEQQLEDSEYAHYMSGTSLGLSVSLEFI